MIITRKFIAQLLRKIHLRQFADNLMYIGNVLANRKSNHLFSAEHPGFIPPPSYLAYDAYNHTNWQDYYETGLSHARLVSDLITEYVSEKDIKIFEWGCGPARVIRHLQEIAGFENVELYGSDCNKDSIKWCRKNIANVHFSRNHFEPPLPLDSAFFDCVYAISIFTHLSLKMHYAWIAELFRIVKPNGILIFTTHGDLYAKNLSSEEKAKYDSGTLVTRDHVREGKKLFAAYHPPMFIKSELLKDYEVIKHISNPAQCQLDQEVWVVKKAS